MTADLTPTILLAIAQHVQMHLPDVHCGLTATPRGRHIISMHVRSHKLLPGRDSLMGCLQLCVDGVVCVQYRYQMCGPSVYTEEFPLSHPDCLRLVLDSISKVFSAKCND